MYIWQEKGWPNFTWNENALRDRLNRIRLLQGRLLGRTDGVPNQASQDVEMDALIQNAIRTSEIEGEVMNVSSVRSSVARHLGVQRAGITGRTTPESECLVELLLEATHEPEKSLCATTLCSWQSMLFPEGPGPFVNLRIGELRGDQPMQVVSGRVDRPTIHFEAPPRKNLDAELDRFLEWFNQPPAGLDDLIRAGIAHLWLITLHPFDDGNGRLTRAVTDRALAKAERHSVRFYSLSAAIMARRNAYYEHLENTQKGSLDITTWLNWFLETLEESLQQALLRVDRVMEKSRFWQRHAMTPLSERQIKVLNRLLDSVGEEFEYGINARKYQSLAKVSKPTATRDLGDLLSKGCIVQLPGGGRSTRYALLLSAHSQMA
jgi:Fic family protein